MELKDLADDGAKTHYIDAVDFGSVQVKESEWRDEFVDAQMLRFRLDGVMYCVTEDPEDGYRSSMRDIQISDAPAMNAFPAEPVTLHYRSERDNGFRSSACDLLEIRSIATGEILLIVGTDDTDDYYPTFVSEWHPECLSVNRDRRPERGRE